MSDDIFVFQAGVFAARGLAGNDISISSRYVLPTSVSQVLHLCVVMWVFLLHRGLSRAISAFQQRVRVQRRMTSSCFRRAFSLHKVCVFHVPNVCPMMLPGVEIVQRLEMPMSLSTLPCTAKTLASHHRSAKESMVVGSD